MSHAPSDPVRSATGIVQRAVLLPALMACPSLLELLQLISDAYFYRLVHDQARFKLPENFQTGRTGSSEDRAKARLRTLFAPFAHYVACQAVAINHRAGVSGRPLPAEVMDDLFRHAGLHLGVQERNRVLFLLEEGSPARGENDWYPRLCDAPPLEPTAAREGALFCFLGALLPVVIQRFQAVEGSLLWYGELVLPPEVMRRFFEELEQALTEWLEARAVLWEEIPKGRAEEYVLLELSGLGGVPAPVEWREQTPAWARLIAATVGGDVAVRIGNVDLAAAVLQRAAIDAAFEVHKRERTQGKPTRGRRSKGERTYDFIGRRYGLKTGNTISSWRRGPLLEDPEGNSPANGGFAGVAALQVQAILAEQRPKAVTKARLLAAMRERCRGPAGSPEIVEMALHQLLREDRVLWTRNGRGEDLYGLRDTYLTLSAEELQKMGTAMEGYLRELPGLTRALQEGHPGTHVFSHRRWIRREYLEGYREAIRQVRERVREQHSRRNDDLSMEEARLLGFEQCRAFLLSRVTPVSPK